MKTVAQVLVGGILVYGTIGCGRKEPEQPVPAAKPAASPLDLRLVLSGYEEARAGLVADDLGGAKSGARALEEAASAQARQADPDRRALLEAAADHAGRLQTASDLTAARAAFGEVSRAVVALGAKDPSAVAGRRVFLCPMVTDGYNQWIQTGERLSNPYMGKAMPECGSEGSWR